MKPIEFEDHNLTFAKHQPQYLPLPAYLNMDGCVVTCWALSWIERLRVLVNGKIWLIQLTFNHPLQPQRLSVEQPFNLAQDCADEELSRLPMGGSNA